MADRNPGGSRACPMVAMPDNANDAFDTDSAPVRFAFALVPTSGRNDGP
jgi:hypothetical protein